MKMLRGVVLAYALIAMIAVGAQASEPGYDDLVTGTRQTGRGADSALTRAAVVGVSTSGMTQLARNLVRSGALALGRRATGAFGLAAMGGGGLLLGALLEYTMTGRVDWGLLTSATAGSVIALLALNPVTLPATIAIAALGGLAGELAWRAVRERASER